MSKAGSGDARGGVQADTKGAVSTAKASMGSAKIGPAGQSDIRGGEMKSKPGG
jgi:hypothetical protein